MKKGTLLSLLALGGLLVGADEGNAQVRGGAQALFGSEMDFGLGVIAAIDLGTTAPLEVQAGFNLFFPDGPREFWEFNGNLWYQFETGGQGLPYAGGGLNIGRANTGIDGGADTQLGLNLGGGYRFNYSNTAPFVEARFTVAGHEQFVVGFGVLFGGG
jgi:hypothetical protein